jgi:UDP-N-acetylglucosamine/UDP-N-acetylgalactosamine diphosphorylase
LIFILKTDKLLELCSNSNELNKLYHKAIKKIPFYNPDTNEIEKPIESNGYKFELFIHNFLPFCESGRFGVLKVNREEEFGPVKNAEGASQDSPNTARNLIFQQHIKWATANGARVVQQTPEPAFEIDFLLTYEGEGLETAIAHDQEFVTPFYLAKRPLSTPY